MDRSHSAPSDRVRPFDVVVFGATGFTGRLVAEYLAAHHAGEGLRWAIAGRDTVRLHAVRDELASTGSAPSVVVADSRDRASLEAMAASTRVVCTTVGPYARHGDPLVAACIDQGADQVDLTGEPHYVRHTVDTRHDDAVAAGVRIVHCCGFDSIPSDLGTLALQDAVLARDGRPCDTVQLEVIDLRGGVSGGTIASMVEVMDAAHDPAVREILSDPYALNPPDSRSGPDGADQATPRHDPITGTWTAPFVMAAINARVVRRTNALLDFRYGRDFRYGEVTRTGRGAIGAVRAGFLAAGIALFYSAMRARTTRRPLRRWVLPDPGEGPGRDAVESGHFTMRLSGRRNGSEVGHVLVHGWRDPGYGATACMLAESALCLALDRDVLPTRAGVLTPAAAMGSTLRARLDRTDVRFDVHV